MMKANKYKFVGSETVVQYFSSHAHIAHTVIAKMIKVLEGWSSRES